MGLALAFLIFTVGIAGLFYLDRDKNARNAKALWLPVIWLWIVGSRPASMWIALWFGIGAPGGPQGLDAQLDGSPADALFFMVLLAAAIVVLAKRKRATISLLKACSPLLVFLAYCLASCLWSPFPSVAFKRWIKDVGDLAMVLVITTDHEPIKALHKIFSRVGFILLPYSIFLIRYSILGRGFAPDGSAMNTGVTTNKNSLGLIAFTVSLGAVWNCFSLLRAKKSRIRGRQLISQLVLVGFGVTVLQQAHSATSISCFILGSFLITATNLSFFRLHRKQVHALFLGIVFLGAGTIFLGGEGTVVKALGRKPNLSDRTTIWKDVIPICPNPVLGAGFESFWNGYGKYVTEGLSIYERGLNSAHNGYIEVYLNLGLTGLVLIGVLLFSGYQRATSAFLRNPEVGSIMLAFLAADAIYSITEAGYRILTPTWFSFVLVLIGSRSIASSAREHLGNADSLMPDKKIKPWLITSRPSWQ